MDPVGGLVSGIGLVFLSGVLHVVTTQASKRSLDRNSAIGIRTKATQLSDSAWLAGHRAARPWIQVTAITGYDAATTAIILSLASMAAKRESPVALIVSLAGYVAVITLLIVATGKANTAARATAHH